ncbi:MAG: ATP-binding cassette domain-containing protein [Filifactoraceae bacterium]
MNIIETKDISFAYGDEKLALDKVSVAIESGKVTAFLGGNGAGKSTLFLNINGVLKPKSGDCYFNGEKVVYNKQGIRKLRESVGIVFQDPNDQLFSASVRNDIAFGALNKGIEPAVVAQMVQKVSKRVGIEELLDKPTHALSFGQKKRVAIAGVLIMEPKVIILDEPTAGLDPSGTTELLQLLMELGNSKDVAIVISTHDVDLVPLYCDYTYIMNGGRIVFGGNSKELLENPEVLRENKLRLPRIAHLMEIMVNKDGLPLDKDAATISQARKSILEMVNRYEKDL